MHAGLLSLLCVFAGCDVVFRVDHIGPSDGGSLDAPEACPADYTVVANAPVTNLYRFVDLPQIWEVAEADCVNDSITDISHLAVLDDVVELAALRAYINAQTGGGFQALVGHARNVDGDPNQFFAVTGEPVPMTSPPWASNEPDNEPPNGIGEETITWFEGTVDMVDGPDSLAQTYICECDHRPVALQFTLR